MTRLPAAERKEQLLDIAAELFSLHGYARATTAELAKAAGVTEPIIYRHFKSKKDLFIALIERTGEQTLGQWEADLQGEADPAQRLSRLIGDNPMVSPQGRAAYRVFLQAISEVQDDDIRRAVTDHITKVKGFIEAELARAQEAGQVSKRFSSEILAWVLVNMGMGYGALNAMGVDAPGVDTSGVHVRDVLAMTLVGRRAEDAPWRHRDR